VCVRVNYYGRGDVLDGGEVRVLPAESAVVQGGDGRHDGAAAPDAVPAQGERGNPEAADAAGHGDCGAVHTAPDGDVHRALLPRQRS